MYEILNDPHCPICGGDAKKESSSGNVSNMKCLCCGTLFKYSPEPQNVSFFGNAVSQSTASNSDGRGPSTVKEMSGADVFERNKDAVAEVTTNEGAGSGFVVSNCGFVLTNAHVVLYQGKLSSGIVASVGGKSYPSRVVAVGDPNDPRSVDLALLYCDRMSSSVSNTVFANSESVRNGERVYCIGNSKGEGICITSGIVSDRSRLIDGRRLIMTDCATNPGNSGGPLINEDGCVIGVHSSARNSAVGMKYAIPSNDAVMFLNCIERKWNVDRGCLYDVSTKNSQEFLGIAGMIIEGVKVLLDGANFVSKLIANARARRR